MCRFPCAKNSHRFLLSKIPIDSYSKFWRKSHNKGQVAVDGNIRRKPQCRSRLKRAPVGAKARQKGGSKGEEVEGEKKVLMIEESINVRGVHL